MKVNVRKAASPEEEGAEIRAIEITEEIQEAIGLLENRRGGIPCAAGSGTVVCRTDEIYYIESVDKRTYVYTKEHCYETKFRLYELEDMLPFHYLRCSKAMIVNIRKIRSVKADLNARMTAELLNGEQIVISRSYVKDLKRKLGL